MREGRRASALRWAAAIATLWLLGACSRGAGTIEGRATIGGQPAAGADVQFFVKAGEEKSGTPFVVGSSGSDGAFRATLPPGEYHVVARKSVREGGRDRTYKGEYRGNPVTVAAGRRAGNVDVALVEMSGGGFLPQDGTGVLGTVTSSGKRAPGAFVYAYPAEAGTVRGPSYAAFARADGEGRFRIALREGSFVVVARRKGGDDESGAMEAGGESGGEGTQVTLARGDMRNIGTIALHAPDERRRRLRAGLGGQDAAAVEIAGIVVRDDGSAVAGVYVMAYLDHRMMGRPAAISGRTGADGAFTLRMARPEIVFLGARSGSGGPVSPGEWVGAYDGSPDHSLDMKRERRRSGIRIRVAEKW